MSKPFRALLKSKEDEITELKRQLAEVPEWIPVEERLPEDFDELILVWFTWLDNGNEQEGSFITDWCGVIADDPPTRVTHWMPLPAPPKAQEVEHD